MTKRIEIGRTVAPTGSPVITAPPARVEVRVVSQLNTMLTDAYSIIAAELRYYARKVQTAPLDAAESVIVARHVAALSTLKDQERKDRELDDLLSRLSDEQLVKLGASALKLLRGGAA